MLLPVYYRQTLGFTSESRARTSCEKPISGKRRPCHSAHWIWQEPHLSSFSLLKSCENTGATLFIIAPNYAYHLHNYMKRFLLFKRRLAAGIPLSLLPPAVALLACSFSRFPLRLERQATLAMLNETVLF